MDWLSAGVGGWADALLASLPVGRGGDYPLEVEMPKKIQRREGYHTFRWVQTNAVGMDAEHLLRRYGVPVSRRYFGVENGQIIAGCDVPAQQAQWSEYLLCRAGWALTTPMLDPAHNAVYERALRGGASRPVGGGRIRRQGFVAKVFAVADELAGPGESGRERTSAPQTSWRRPQPNSAPAQGFGFFEMIKRVLGGIL